VLSVGWFSILLRPTPAQRISTDINYKKKKKVKFLGKLMAEAAAEVDCVGRTIHLLFAPRTSLEAKQVCLLRSR
jgi:hypothetical protein